MKILLPIIKYQNSKDRKSAQAYIFFWGRKNTPKSAFVKKYLILKEKLFIFLYIPSSWVEIRVPIKNQLPGYPEIDYSLKKTILWTNSEISYICRQKTCMS